MSKESIKFNSNGQWTLKKGMDGGLNTGSLNTPGGALVQSEKEMRREVGANRTHDIRVATKVPKVSGVNKGEGGSQCDHCGKQMPASEGTETPAGDIHCESCTRKYGMNKGEMKGNRPKEKKKEDPEGLKPLHSDEETFGNGKPYNGESKDKTKKSEKDLQDEEHKRDEDARKDKDKKHVSGINKAQDALAMDRMRTKLGFVKNMTEMHNDNVRPPEGYVGQAATFPASPAPDRDVPIRRSLPPVVVTNPEPLW